MKHLFIVGCYRSGTTMLRLMLSQHPRIFIPPETFSVPRLAEEAEASGILGSPDGLEKFVERIRKDFISQGWSKFPSLDVLKHRLQGDVSFSTIYSSILEWAAEEDGKHNVLWVGDNTPSYVMSVVSLGRLFPDAKFINIVRDGRDVAASIKKLEFKSCFNPVACAHEWVERVSYGMAAERAFGKKRVLTVRYEDIVLSTESMLTDICRFIDVEYQPTMLDFHQSVSATKIAKQNHHQNAIRPVTNSSIGRYSEQLTKREIELFERITHPYLQAFGYYFVGRLMAPLSNELKYRHFALNYIRLFLGRLLMGIRLRMNINPAKE